MTAPTPPPPARLPQVSWQALQPELREPRSCAAAVLTSHRIMIVSGDLKVITEAPAEGGALAAVHGITSMCWAGPALLYTTALGARPPPAAGAALQRRGTAPALPRGALPRWTGQPQHAPGHALQSPLHRASPPTPTHTHPPLCGQLQQPMIQVLPMPPSPLLKPSGLTGSVSPE
jgi:hypothetical protein